MKHELENYFTYLQGKDTKPLLVQLEIMLLKVFSAWTQ